MTTISKRGKKAKSRFLQAASSGVEFFSSGCAILDAVMGGGYPEGRVTNIVGDRSTGKTLLAIEAMINFIKKYPDDSGIVYVEAESAFDRNYAAAMGLDVDRVDFFEDLETVEEVFSLVDEYAGEDSYKNGTLVIVDSLDALSDAAEQKRDLTEGTYGTKPKQLSTGFRKGIRKWKQANVTLLIISQVRDNIGVTFGKKHKRSGGKALDFYASLVIWLAETSKRLKTKRGVKRPVGVNITAKSEKNKVGLPFRSCDLPIIFGYGIEDVEAGIKYLIEVDALDELNKKLSYPVKAKPTAADFEKYMYDPEISSAVKKVVPKVFNEVETDFLVTKTKY